MALFKNLIDSMSIYLKLDHNKNNSNNSFYMIILNNKLLYILRWSPL